MRDLGEWVDASDRVIGADDREGNRDGENGGCGNDTDDGVLGLVRRSLVAEKIGVCAGLEPVIRDV